MVRDFNANVADPNRIRDKASLQAKFRSLSQSNKPTGDPNCPDEIRRAKRCERARLEKANIKPLGTGKERPQEEDEDEDDDNEVVVTDTTNSPAANTRSKAASKHRAASGHKGKTPSVKKDANSKPEGAKSAGDDFITVFLTNAEADRKADRRRERCRQKRENRER